MLNRQCELTLPRVTAAPTASSSAYAFNTPVFVAAGLQRSRGARRHTGACQLSRVVLAEPHHGDARHVASLARALVLGSWVGVRHPFRPSLFLTAPRVVLPQDPSTNAGTCFAADASFVGKTLFLNLDGECFVDWLRFVPGGTPY